MVREDLGAKDPRVYNESIAESGLLQTRSTNVLFRRKEQMKRWEDSETNKEPAKRKKANDGRTVQFQDSDVFLSACISGDEIEVADLLGKGADINTTTVDGLTALHQAVIDRKLSMVEFLVREGADINAQDNEGWTPLHAAACCGHPEIVTFLLNQDADLNLTNSDKELPIDLAETDDLRGILEKAYEIRHIDPEDCRDQEEKVMMSDANEWLRTGVLLDRPHPRTGATAIHVSASKGYIKVLNMLLQAGADVNAVDNDGWSALHAAAHWGERHACEILTEHGADFETKSFAGQTCFDVADEDMLSFLEELKGQQRKPEPTQPAPKLIPLRLDSMDAIQKRKNSITRLSTDEKVLVSKRDEAKEGAEIKQLSPTAPEPPKVGEKEPSPPPEAAPAPPLPKVPKVEVAQSDTPPASPSIKSPTSRLAGKFELTQAVNKPSTEPQLPSWRLTGRVCSPNSVSARFSAPSLSPMNTTPTSRNAAAASSPTNSDASPRPLLSVPTPWQNFPSFSLRQSTPPPPAPPAIVESLRLDSAKPQSFNMIKLRSFTPPQREEAEAERKARSKKQRETRRSTQGVSLEQLKSAEELMSQRSTQQQPEPSSPPESIQKSSSDQTVTARACVLTDEQPTRDQPQARTATARRIMVDDSDSENKQDTQTPQSPGSPMPWKSRVLEIAQVGPPENSHINATAAQRRRSRMNPRDRRSTGPVSAEDIETVDIDDQGAEDQPKATTSAAPLAPVARVSVSTTPRQPLTTSLGGYTNRYPSGGLGSERNSSLATSRTSSAGSLQSSSSEPEIIDYKKLYEKEKADNDRLKSTVGDLEVQLSKVRLTSPVQNGIEKETNKGPGAAVLEERERRAYERRIAELEEDLKRMKDLKESNQRLKDENGALIRVISKLSK